jgi:hypothetical protein
LVLNATKINVLNLVMALACFKAAKVATALSRRFLVYPLLFVWGYGCIDEGDQEGQNQWIDVVRDSLEMRSNSCEIYPPLFSSAEDLRFVEY